jgi:hypothetical protein
MQHQVTGGGKKHEEDPEKRNIRPPERLKRTYQQTTTTSEYIYIYTSARSPKIERIVAAGTSNSTPYLNPTESACFTKKSIKVNNKP